MTTICLLPMAISKNNHHKKTTIITTVNRIPNSNISEQDSYFINKINIT